MGAVLLGQSAFLLCVLLMWQLLSVFTPDPLLLPSVPKVFASVVRLLSDPSFLTDFSLTALEIGVAFVIAAPLALLTGFLLGERASRERRAMSPLLYLIMAIPQSIFLPLFIFAFGIGFIEKVIFGATHAYFVIAVNTYAAVRTIPTSFVIAARSFGASKLQIYMRIYVPAMLPLVLTGLRFGMNFCIIGVLLAEMYASVYGVGHRIFAWGEAYQVTPLLSAILIVATTTVIVNELLRIAEVRAASRFGAFQR